MGSLKNVVSNHLSPVNNLFHTGGSGGPTTPEMLFDPYNIFHDQAPKGKTLNEQLSEKGSMDAQNAAVASYNEAIQRKELDRETAGEVFDLLSTGSASDGSRAGQMLADARAGKGIYAVRKITQAERDIQIDQPGRQQLRAGSTPAFFGPPAGRARSVYVPGFNPGYGPGLNRG